MQLMSLLASLKQLFLANPDSAIAQLHATGILDFANLSCRVLIPANDGNLHTGLNCLPELIQPEPNRAGYTHARPGGQLSRHGEL